jgi:hypothetical protein
MQPQNFSTMTPALPIRLARGAQRVAGSGTWTWVPLVILSYALLYDNSTSVPSALGADWTKLMQLPREVRIVEAVSVFLAVLVLLDRKMSRLSRYLLLATLAFTALAVGSQMTHPLVSLIDAFRLVYAYVLPLLLFIIGREGRLNARSRTYITRLLLGWVILCAVMSWYEFVWLGYPLGDDITGLNKDAHANGNLIFFMAILLTARAFFLRKRKLFLLVVALVITAVLSSVLKSEIFSLFALAIIVWVNISNRETETGRKIKKSFRKRVVPVVAAALLVYVMGLAFADLDTFNDNRAGDVMSKILAEPLNFGPIASHLIAFSAIKTTPQIFLLGNGPYSYANPVSVGQGLEAGALSKYAQSSLLLQYGESTESAKVTLTSSVLAELGLPALLVLLAAYISVGWALWRERTSTDPEQAAYATGLTGCWLIIILTSMVTLAGSWDTISVAAPIMFLAGITCRLGNKSTDNELVVSSQ